MAFRQSVDSNTYGVQLPAIMPSQQIEQAAINKIQISTFKENKTKNVANLKPTPPTLAVVIILHMGPHPPRHGGSGWAAATPPIQHLVRQLEGKRIGQTTNNNSSVHNTRRSILQCPFIGTMQFSYTHDLYVT